MMYGACMISFGYVYDDNKVSHMYLQSVLVFYVSYVTWPPRSILIFSGRESDICTSIDLAYRRCADDVTWFRSTLAVIMVIT